MSKIADEFPSRFCYAYIMKEDARGFPGDRAAPFFVEAHMLTMLLIGFLVIREAFSILEEMY